MRRLKCAKQADFLISMKNENHLKDEHYIIDLCDKVLNENSLRQHRFNFLLGDKGKNGRQAKLPVDSFYPKLNLVIEYKEKQHTEEISFFDKKNRLTISGVHRGEQRKVYDQRRKEILSKHNIHLIELLYSYFTYDSQKRLIRNKIKDIKILKEKLKLWIN